jgi:hypothetical protein
VGQIHPFSEAAIISSQPIIGEPFTPLVRMLESTDVVSQAHIIEEPRAGIRFAVKCPEPIIEKPTINQIQNIIGLTVESQNPIIEEPIVTITVLCSTVGVTVENSIVDSPILTQEHQLVSVDQFVPSVFISTSSIKQIHTILIQDIPLGFPIITVPTLQHIHTLQVADINTGIVELPIPVINQICAFYTPSIQLDEYIGIPILTGEHKLVFNNVLLNPPQVQVSALGNTNTLSIDKIESPELLIGSPYLQCIYTLSIVLDLPAFTVEQPTVFVFNSLTSLSIAARAPTISLPILPGLGLYPATSDRIVEILEDIRLVVLT